MTSTALKMVPKVTQMPPQIDPKWPLGAPQGRQEAKNPMCSKIHFLVKKAAAMSL